jgi:hypothetical protein
MDFFLPTLLCLLYRQKRTIHIVFSCQGSGEDKKHWFLLMLSFRPSKKTALRKNQLMKQVWLGRCDELLEGMNDAGNMLQLQPCFNGRFTQTRATYSALEIGRQRYNDMIDMMDRMVSATKKAWRLSDTQRRYHRVFMDALIPHIYGIDTFEQHQRVILKSHDITMIDIAVLVRASRRAGKTLAVSVMIAAFLLCVPGHNGLIISQHQAASSALMSQVRAFIIAIDMDRRVVQFNQKTMRVSVEPLPIGCGLKSDTARQLSMRTTTSGVVSLPSTVNSKYSHLHTTRIRVLG